jgi:hypothetical protein
MVLMSNCILMTNPGLCNRKKPHDMAARLINLMKKYDATSLRRQLVLWWICHTFALE